MLRGKQIYEYMLNTFGDQCPSYATLKNWITSLKRGKKIILKSISGNFRSGHLTGILGSSGAGKTTLLNVLAGDTQTNISGKIHVNGRPRIMKNFCKTACYIRQEDLIQPFLTVKESISIVAELKLGQSFSAAEKECVTSGILSMIGLGASLNTSVENLSGGERKRLIIALELVNNPGIFFLDEPTTGLDDVSMRSCINLLKCLTLQGRNVICTLHQPSDSLLKLFDTVYFMSNGYCIYNGTVANLIPFLSTAKFPCPKNYNPADYIIEIVHDQQSNAIELKNIIDNGSSTTYSQNSGEDSNHLLKRESSNTRPPTTRVKGPAPHTAFSGSKQLLKMASSSSTQSNKRKHERLALVQNMKILSKVESGVPFTDMANHFHIGRLTVYDIQKNRNKIENCVTEAESGIGKRQTMRTATIPNGLTREDVEGWFEEYTEIYELHLTDDELLNKSVEPENSLNKEVVLRVDCTVKSEDTLDGVDRGACIGSAVAVPLVLLTVYGIGHGDSLGAFIELLMFMSYVRHAFIGLATAIYKDQGRFQCDEVFCFFGDSEFLLGKMGMAENKFITEAAILFVFFVIHQVLLYIFLKIRVSSSRKLFRNWELMEL
ncbi:abc transporter g family member 28 [Holotrichia oblita]|uniref:Abc transporter g family member 28 n=1 Tax=Holotrichia oblita TaxID=644536 RepID=A0ACB9SZC5_HOLOL|nr:abc transporter g family member 28 [Holotrichia oblita]